MSRYISLCSMSVILYRDYMIAYGYRRQLKPTTPRTAPVSKKTKKMSVGIIQLEPRVSPYVCASAPVRLCVCVCTPTRLCAYAGSSTAPVRVCARLCVSFTISKHLAYFCLMFFFQIRGCHLFCYLRIVISRTTDRHTVNRYGNRLALSILQGLASKRATKKTKGLTS